MTMTMTNNPHAAFGGPWDDAPAAREQLAGIIDAALATAPATIRITCDLMNHDSVALPGIGDRVLINVIDRGRDHLQLGSAWPLIVVKQRPEVVADDVARLVRLVAEVLPDGEDLDQSGFTLDAEPADVPVGGGAVGTGTTADGDGRVAVFIRHRAEGLAARALLDAEAAERLAAELLECAALIRDVDE